MLNGKVGKMAGHKRKITHAESVFNANTRASTRPASNFCWGENYFVADAIRWHKISLWKAAARINYTHRILTGWDDDYNHTVENNGIHNSQLDGKCRRSGRLSFLCLPCALSLRQLHASLTHKNHTRRLHEKNVSEQAHYVDLTTLVSAHTLSVARQTKARRTMAVVNLVTKVVSR